MVILLGKKRVCLPHRPWPFTRGRLRRAGTLAAADVCIVCNREFLPHFFLQGKHWFRGRGAEKGASGLRPQTETTSTPRLRASTVEASCGGKNLELTGEGTGRQGRGFVRAGNRRRRWGRFFARVPACRSAENTGLGADAGERHKSGLARMGRQGEKSLLARGTAFLSRGPYAWALVRQSSAFELSPPQALFRSATACFPVPGISWEGYRRKARKKRERKVCAGVFPSRGGRPVWVKNRGLVCMGGSAQAGACPCGRATRKNGVGTGTPEAVRNVRLKLLACHGGAHAAMGERHIRIRMARGFSSFLRDCQLLARGGRPGGFFSCKKRLRAARRGGG